MNKKSDPALELLILLALVALLWAGYQEEHAPTRTPEEIHDIQTK